MYITRAPLGLLVPTQCAYDPFKLESILSRFDPSRLEPIPVLLHEGRYVMGDGHNRGFLMHLHGVQEAPIRVIESAAEASKHFKGLAQILTPQTWIRWRFDVDTDSRLPATLAQLRLLRDCPAGSVVARQGNVVYVYDAADKPPRILGRLREISAFSSSYSLSS